jgi:hypothetical protein
MSVTKYPKVCSEWDTIKKLQEGFSIARFGDGEFKMMDGAGYVREPPNKKLAHELRQVLRKPHPMCLRGIPTFDERSPKYVTWKKHIGRFTRLMKRTSGDFYSAFISRPDSAPWIRTKEYALEVQKLWAGKRTVVLCERDGSAIRAVGADRPSTVHIVCPSHEAYAHIDYFENRIRAAEPDIAILSCGMTATCLANRLAGHGIQAIDFGSGGSFIAKLLTDA